MILKPHGTWNVSFCVFALMLFAGCGGGNDEDAERALPRGAELAGGVTVAGVRTHPIEPMSPTTSGRCAFRLEHRASGTWTELFPVPGGRGAKGFEPGDVCLPDGRRHRDPPAALGTAFRMAWEDLGNRLASTTGGQLARLCQDRDSRLPASARFWIPIVIGLILLAGASLLVKRSGAMSTFAALAGLVALVVAVLPVLWGHSFGTQELQRLLTALQPLSTLASGDHGDPRHTAGLFLIYAPVARMDGTILGLRIFGFAVLVLAFATWVLLRWRKSTGETLTGLALLVHPVLLKNNLEVGPYALYTAGMIALYLAVVARPEIGRGRFAAGLAAQLFLAATNQLGAVLGTVIMAVALVRGRAGLSRGELLGRGLLVAVIAVPFLVGIALTFGAESELRHAAERTPELAWGSRPFWLLARGLFSSAFYGHLLVLLIVSVTLLGWLVGRTRWDGLLWVGLGVATLVAFALVSPRLRVQPYYGLYAVPLLLLGLANLVAGLPDRARRRGLGLVVLAVVSIDFVAAAPVMSRRDADPQPARAVATMAQKHARDCPVLMAATNDLVLPLVPELIDVRRRSRPRRAESAGGALQVTRWSIPEKGMELLTLFGRHQLPPRQVVLLLRRLVQERSRRCVQFLYDRRFPLPRVYHDLQAGCRTTLDKRWYRLFRCERLQAVFFDAPGLILQRPKRKPKK